MMSTILTIKLYEYWFLMIKSFYIYISFYHHEDASWLPSPKFSWSNYCIFRMRTASLSSITGKKIKTWTLNPKKNRVVSLVEKDTAWTTVGYWFIGLTTTELGSSPFRRFGDLGMAGQKRWPSGLVPRHRLMILNDADQFRGKDVLLEVAIVSC